MRSLAATFALTTALFATSATLEEETRAWHEKRLERLKAEDGWLSLVGLHWLDEGENVAGSGKGAAVLLPASAPAKLGTFTRRGGKVSFSPAEGQSVTLAGKPFTGGELRTDEKGTPDVLETGTLKLMVIARGQRLGVRVKDSEAKTRKEFRGIDRFPVTAEWRKEARWEPARPGETISVPNVLGDSTDTPLAGTAVFTHGGKEYRLQATQEGESLFFVFGDLTNRKESYGAGRYLYTPLPKDGSVVLDFNRAYNPPCAFTPYATCPLPSKQNRLNVRIEAGEKRYAKR